MRKNIFLLYWVNYINKGSFFRNYPRKRRLISLNKRNTGELNEEFNLRHDWHSLLTEENHKENELKFTSYTKDNFPNADILFNYFNDFKEKYNLNIQYNSDINGLNCKRDSQKAKKTKCISFELYDQKMNKYDCKWMVY